MKATIEGSLQQSIDYGAYRTLINELLEAGKTSGPDQSEAMVGYTKMNVVRMKRLDKTIKIFPETEVVLEKIKRPQTWLVITEAWCGDAAQILPVVEKMGAANALITVRYVFRDEHPALMDLFLTNGSRSIPIIVVLDAETQKVLGHWGPRPTKMQEKVLARKNDPNASPYSEFVIELQKWYLKDRSLSTQQEFSETLSRIAQ